MPTCCVPHCFNNEKTQPSRTFHRLPFEPKRRMIWINCIQLKKEPTCNFKVCSDHFTQTDFYTTRKNCKRLRKSAKPIFTSANKENIDPVINVSNSTCSSLQLMNIDPVINVSNSTCSSLQLMADTEHIYYTDVQVLKRKYDDAILNLEKKGVEMCKLKRQCIQSSKKINTLIQKLKDKEKLCDEAYKQLQAYKEIPVELFKKPTSEYNSEQKKFAATLHFYGRKAYEYLREKINLPHPSSIRRWMMNINSSPGISIQAIEYLKKKQVEDLDNYEKCILVIDGMSIKKHIEWDNRQKKMVGFVDLGLGSTDSESTEATETIVVMAVGLKKYWKIPIAYFLTHGISAETQTNLILDIINVLFENNIIVVSLTMDAHSVNVKMSTLLGCSLDPQNIHSKFTHPSDNSKSVFIFFDPCHLIKNIRSALQSLSEIQTNEGIAKWQDIVNLEELQHTIGLRAANKLTPKHIHYKNNKMKVRLATQTLSSSVAAALKFASESGCKKFESVEGTVKFISLFDTVFDIFNSRTKFSDDFKKPIHLKNFNDIKIFLVNAKTYLLSMADSESMKICESNRKMCIVGFLINISSIIELSEQLIKGPHPYLKYFLTYKLSQDHLELFFSAIRQFGGFNNNPSALQFSNAYRALITNAGIPIKCFNTTNCVPQTKFSILNLNNVDDPKPILLFHDALFDHEYCHFDSSGNCFLDGILQYIAGWVVRKVSSKIFCTTCASALIGPAKHSGTGLLQFKNKGGLTIPSSSVVSIVQHCEKFIRSTVNINQVQYGQWEKITVMKMMQTMQTKDIFDKLNNHFLETSIGMDFHFYKLLKIICEEFLTLRRYHAVKLTNFGLNKNSIRHKFNKIVLFKNQ